MEIKIIDNFNRKKLNEGRSFGLGFAILNKKSNKKYETLNAFTACKDYLNDFMYIESSKKPLNKIHGFKHTLTNIFDNKRYFYLGVNTLNHNTGYPWNSFNECERILLGNTENLLFLINKFESHINLFKSRTTIQAITRDTLILRVPIFWSKFGFLISLYTLYIRCFFNTTSDVIDFKTYKCFIDADSYLMKSITKFMSIKNYKNILKFKYKNISASTIHNGGIVEWLRDYEKKITTSLQ